MQQPNSGWTIETLKDHVDEVLLQMDLRYQQRYDAQIKALDAALLAAEKAVTTALLAAKEAVIKAENAADKRFEGLNELRTVVEDISKLQMPRAEAESRLSALSEKVNEARGKSIGLNAGWGYLLGAVGLMGGIIGIVLGVR